MTCVYNYINEAPEAETDSENTNCGITWNQEDNDMLYGRVLYTHINSEICSSPKRVNEAPSC